MIEEVVVILFPKEYKQWRTACMDNNITTRKTLTLMILLVVTREARGSSGWRFLLFPWILLPMPSLLVDARVLLIWDELRYNTDPNSLSINTMAYCPLLKILIGLPKYTNFCILEEGSCALIFFVYHEHSILRLKKHGAALVDNVILTVLLSLITSIFIHDTHCIHAINTTYDIHYKPVLNKRIYLRLLSNSLLRTDTFVNALYMLVLMIKTQFASIETGSREELAHRHFEFYI